MKPFLHTITVNNKKYNYTITPINKKEIHFRCPVAKINQEFLAEDIPQLLIDLPEIILSSLSFQVKQKAAIIRFRISATEKTQIQHNAIKAGYSTISAYLRSLALG